MKSFAFVLLVVQAVLMQNAYCQLIRTSLPCGIPTSVVSSPVISTVAQPSVAASLADTLSLLTVSSLLAESLPLNPNVVAAVPVPVSVGPTYIPTVGFGGCGCGGGCGYGCGCGCGYGCGCGCGCGCGYNGLGYSYIL